MRVLCLAGDRTIAYLIKHVLAFEGFAVEVCLSEAALADGLSDGAAVVVTVEPLAAALPAGTAVVVAPDPFDEHRLVLAVRRAAARVAAGLPGRAGQAPTAGVGPVPVPPSEARERVET
ncbi:MAG TPA: hypothetical protein VF406_06860 [Thermodesulfobacteriota bacterium]